MVKKKRKDELGGTVTTAVLADYFNVTPRSIQKLTVEGILTKQTRGKYELKYIINEYVEYQKKITREKYDKKIENQTDAVRRKWIAEAELKEMEVAEKKKVLVDFDKLKGDYWALFRVTRDSILKIPDRVGDIIAAESDAMRCKQILKEELTLSLKELSEVKL